MSSASAQHLGSQTHVVQKKAMSTHDLGRDWGGFFPPTTLPSGCISSLTPTIPLCKEGNHLKSVPGEVLGGAGNWNLHKLVHALRDSSCCSTAGRSACLCFGFYFSSKKLNSRNTELRSGGEKENPGAQSLSALRKKKSPLSPKASQKKKGRSK